jgi:DNA-binding transcriptional MerR regulator
MARRASRKASTQGAVLISRTVLCSMSGISERQLLIWENEDLLSPAAGPAAATQDNPLYDISAVKRVALIRSLSEELEVNLPGIGVILHLLDRIGR